jgi:polyphosphate kinase 2 (PPK2 family)
MGNGLKKYRIDGPRSLRLSRFDPGARPFSVGDKVADKARVAELAGELAVVQDRFYALRQNKLLLVLQGMDTSGKDGTIRAVFQAILWRHHRDVPGRGEVVIFNRSHYEAVLIEYVHGWIDAAERKRRLARIVEFERLLAETGTTIVKCFLHISKDEQRRRLQERIDDPQKHWKFNPQDLEERKLWDKYEAAYEEMLGRTGTAYAPWFVVPADSKTQRNLMISEILLATLGKLAPSYPPPQQKLAGLKVR